MNTLLKLLKYSLFFIPLLLIYLVSPIKIIRFRRITTETFGELAEHIETYQCKKKLNNEIEKKYLDFFCYGLISNIQLALMVKRKLNILPRVLIEPLVVMNRFFSKYIKRLNIHEIDIRFYRDVNNLYSKFSPNIEFTKNEIEMGQKILSEMGIDKNKKFICFDIRDDAYKKKFGLLDIDWSYHKFRNFDSDNFIKAAEKLADKGFIIFRMGKHVNKKFISENKSIIDYANSRFRSDFMDIYLGAHCEFCVTTGSGFSSIPLIFNRPLAAITVPVGLIQTYNDKFINLTKHHFHNGKKLNAKEIFEKGLGFLQDAKNFEEKEITLKEPSSDELCEFVNEAFDIFFKKNLDSENNELQSKFRSEFKKYLDFAELNDPIYQKMLNRGHVLHPEKIKGFFGSNFLNKNNFFN